MQNLPDVDALGERVIEPPGLFVPMFDVPFNRPIPTMCSLLIRRDALLRVGVMDEAFKAMQIHLQSTLSTMSAHV